MPVQLVAPAPSQKVTIMMGAPSDRSHSKVTLPQSMVKPTPPPSSNVIAIDAAP